MFTISEMCICVYGDSSYRGAFKKTFFPTISEEVFASNGALWWSSTGKYLAYLELNDTEVHKVEFSWYGSDQYPQTMAVPYPKVGISCTSLKHRM